MINVMLVEDHAVLRDGLKKIIDMAEDLTVISEAVTGEQAVRKLAHHRPDVILMDINMPGKNGIEVTKIIKEKYPQVKILILTMHDHEEYFLAAIRHGADGYMLKESPSEQVIEAIRSVFTGESVVHPSLMKTLVSFHRQQNEERVRKDELTVREKEVLTCLVKGLSNKEIGKRLFISEKTVKIHVSKIFKKLNVKSRSQVVLYAMQKQLVPIPPN
ncbi:response regulator [Salirhabdus salicampi]|uniref:response regulator n=1 Tax=Salirhabdus salicampi TaxID=476102 RepID=UPI0020C41181|nr:response regulator transcription factor [Salirhabdus salicampi]MCP8617791.1 response regulator transcription factor [Salirhabdus salicampi]